MSFLFIAVLCHRTTRPKKPNISFHGTRGSFYIVLFGGYYTDGTFLDDLDIYDSRFNQWSSPIVNRERCELGTCHVGNVLEDLKTTGNIEQLRSLPPYGFDGDYPQARAEHAAVALNGKMYLFGGVTKSFGYTRSIFFRSLSVDWKRIDTTAGYTLPWCRAGHAMVFSRVFSLQGYTQVNHLYLDRKCMY